MNYTTDRRKSQSVLRNYIDDFARGLPVSDPHFAGYPWFDNDIIRISSGVGSGAPTFDPPDTFSEFRKRRTEVLKKFKIILANMPTTDPNVAGLLWLDMDKIAASEGEDEGGGGGDTPATALQLNGQTLQLNDQDLTLGA